MVISSLPVSDRKLRETKLQTEQDEQLSVLKQVILDGWPVYRKQCQPEIIDSPCKFSPLSEIFALVLCTAGDNLVWLATQYCL